jgi:CheY-like chemotaxis protein
VLSSAMAATFQGAALSKYILIVDDSETVRATVRTYLECQAHFEVCGEAVDGLDAIEKVRILNPDLIILDLSMPRMNGFQAARHLRSLRFLAPIILFTLYAEAIRPEDALAAGVNAVVSKDDLAALQRHIDRLLVVPWPDPGA